MLRNVGVERESNLFAGPKVRLLNRQHTVAGESGGVHGSEACDLDVGDVELNRRGVDAVVAVRDIDYKHGVEAECAVGCCFEDAVGF